MPVDVGLDLDTAKRIYRRWPDANVDSTVESEALLRALLKRWPSLAERPSRMGAVFVIDEDAPFQVDIDQGLVVLEVGWGSLIDVLPEVHALAREAGLAMFLPFEGEVLRRDEGDLREAYEHRGRLVRPEEDADLSVDWFVRQTIEIRSIEQEVEDSHLGQRGWNHDEGGGAAVGSHPLADSSGHVIFLWSDPCKNVSSAQARVQRLTSGTGAGAADSLAKEDRASVVAAFTFLNGIGTSIGDHIGGHTGTAVVDLGVAVVLRVPPDAVETMGQAAALAGQRFGLQMFDATANALA